MTTSELLEAYDPPAHWKRIRLRWLSKRYAGGTPDTKNPEYWDGGSIPWLNSGSVNQGTITQPSDYITDLALKESSAKWIPQGGLVMALAGQGKTKATVGYLDIETTGNQSLAAIVPQNIDGKYLYWWLSSQYRTLRNLSSQDGRDGLNLEMIGSIVCPVPPVDVQGQIARFLDEKTARIDGLVEKKRALLERLNEKRRALITQAVTKGLNSKAPMKSSGINWLGDIPTHWEVLPLKRLLVDAVGLQMGPFGGMLTDLPDYETGYKLYGQENTISGDFSLGRRWIEEERYQELRRYELVAGDLVITRKGSLGNCRRVPADIVPGIADSDTIRIRPEPTRLKPEWALLLLHEAQFISEQITAERRGAILSGLNTTVVGSLLFTVPPVHEQTSVIQSVQRSINSVERVADLICSSILKLQEQRSALITAAVTGQIAGLQ